MSEVKIDQASTEISHTPLQSLSPNVAADKAVAVNDTSASQKKKKKKRSRKPTKSKETSPQTWSPVGDDDDERPPMLCISRNKHWRYISSYHVRSSRYCLITARDEYLIGSMASTTS